MSPVAATIDIGPAGGNTERFGRLLMDMTPKGRNECDGGGMSDWMKRHDDDAAQTKSAKHRCE